MTRPIPLRTVAIHLAAYIAVVTLFWNADAIRDWFWRVVG